MGCFGSKPGPAPSVVTVVAKRDACRYGAACNEQCDMRHRAIFSHPGDPEYPLRKPCTMGEDCPDKSTVVHCAKFSHPGDPDYNGPRKPCKYGASCKDKDEKHIMRFVHPGDPDFQIRKACRFGLKCFRKSDDHVAEFSHPGDMDYRKGCVTFENGIGPEFETLRQLFDFCDPHAHGNFVCKEDFQYALVLLSGYRPDEHLDVDHAWCDLEGESNSFVGFAKFAAWAQQIGAVLPIGIAVVPAEFKSNKMSCGFKFHDGRRCDCKNFSCSGSDSVGSKHYKRQNSTQMNFCTCGHKRSMHAWRGNAKERSLTSDMAAPPYWPQRHDLNDSMLVELGQAAKERFQELLDFTHKHDDNWTRDRGCMLHGRNCHVSDATCAFKHKCQVPTGYKVVAVMRNMNPELWAYYALNRGAITEECQGISGQPFRPITDVETVKVLLEDAPLVTSCNEWFLFHGTSPENCLNICNSNFKVSFAGAGASWKSKGACKGAPLYGYGLYFAERITKADEYSDMVEAEKPFAGTHTVLVCRVLGGRTQYCDSNEIDPVLLQKQVISGPFHSVFGDRVSKLKKPYREVVVYDATQCYPEYIVYYRRLYS